MSPITSTATEKITDPVSPAEPLLSPSSATSAASPPHGTSPTGVRHVTTTAARVRRAVRRLPHLLVKGATKSAAIVALLLLWETAPRLGLVDRIFLPPFNEVARAWWGLA
ncbi:ABC transporter permease, partial [Streptomyces sp. 24-1644]